ncbi:CoA transferase [Aquabacter sp. CN5-332]|uniref:CaiB/BaiF CoA transferase family protein n=1 Tax=Aquabacter sp. CN5-332 TaxID=3156608 RepID=UPI0032B4926D
MSSVSRQILDGLLVLDLSAGVAGQFAGRVLAEHGAEVLLVEPPEGSPLRHVSDPDDRHLFWHLNTAKRSVAIDRATAPGRAVFHRLLQHADVILADGDEDPRPLRVGRPRLITCRVRDFAEGGPYANWRGSEMIHQALSGLMHTTGRAEDEPLYGFGHRASYSAGAAAVTAILGALMLREETDAGRDLDISIHETAVAMSQNLVAQYSYNGSAPTRGPYPGACDIFQCSDGWVSIYCRGDRWGALCTHLGAPDVGTDPLFASSDLLVKNWKEAYERLSAVIAHMACADFISRVTAARALAAKVSTMADALACPHLAARGFWERANDGTRERIVLGPLFRFSRTPRTVMHGAPALGEANAALVSCEAADA